MRRLAINRDITALENDLNSFAPATRAAALRALLDLARAGDVRLEPEADVANMHCHSFYSFNAYGHSPTSLVWLAKKRGFGLVGLVDFDVLDGVDEFLGACEAASVRGSAAVETRVYVPEFSTREINSPGEPGISYHMGIGFASGSAPAEVRPILDAMRARAEQRNRAMLDKINAHLAPARVDYEHDVLPLTPSGNATERHMLVACLRAAEARHQGDALARFWSAKLDTPVEKVAAILGDGPALSNLVRAKLMKKGGVGYAQPNPANFPTVEEFHRLIVACGALPCATWLDGLSAGEQAEPELLALLIDKGAATLNIIPDRNWNIADPAMRQAKVEQLRRVVALAAELDLPLNVGTEMNAFGNKLVDDFGVPEMAPHRQAFMDGARFIYGHVLMQRALGLGWQSEWARAHFPTRAARNAFYLQVGRQAQPGPAAKARLAAAGAGAGAGTTPAEVLAALA